MSSRSSLHCSAASRCRLAVSPIAFRAAALIRRYFAAGFPAGALAELLFAAAFSAAKFAAGSWPVSVRRPRDRLRPAALIVRFLLTSAAVEGAWFAEAVAGGGLRRGGHAPMVFRAAGLIRRAAFFTDASALRPPTIVCGRRR